MEAPGPINFTMFLTMFGEKLNGTDPEDVIRNAFACFDEEGAGKFRRLYCLFLCPKKSYFARVKCLAIFITSILRRTKSIN